MCQLAYAVASLVHERPATVFSMRRSITAVASVVVAFAAVGCSGSGGGSSLASTTTTPVVTTAPPATTTEAPSTTPAATTTTALITDATAADSKVLASQLQAVLDRYQKLYEQARTDPERPFSDQKLIDDFREVAEKDELASLVQLWQAFRHDNSAVRPGPSGSSKLALTGLSHADPTSVQGTFCIYDDSVTYSKASGDVVDDSTVVSRGVVVFGNDGRTWRVSRLDPVDATDVPGGSANPCASEQIS